MKIAVAALGALALTGPALAADFAGPRVEADIGWDHPRAKIDFDDLSAHGHDDGVVYGGEAGYDFRLGHLVVGALAGIDGSSIKDCSTSDVGRSCLKAGRDWAVGGRVGAVLTPRTLVYAKGEYVNVRLKSAFDDAVDTAEDFSSHRDRGGYRLGAGLEFALAPHVYVKGEYRYTNYRKDETEIGSADLSRHQIVGGVGVRF